MLRSYLRLALRALGRRKGFAFINVGGLAVGVACGVLLFLYVRSELSVDAVFEDGGRIARVGSVWREETMGLPIAGPAPVAETLVRAFPEVEDQVRLWLGFVNVRVDGAPALRRNTYVADPNVATFFDLPLLAGDPATALRGDRPVVLHERLARSLFGTTDVVGREVVLETYNNGDQAYTVTAVWKDRPFNSFRNFNGDPDPYELIVPVGSDGDFVGRAGWESWDSRFILLYVKLRAGASVEALQAKLGDFAERFMPEAYHGAYTPRLEPFDTLYLDGGDGAGRRAVWLLSALAALILLVACINFANLATAQALSRAREVGVRKAVGARRGQLLAHFLGEAVLVCTLATTAGAGLARLLQTPFFALTGKPLVLAQPWDATLLLVLAGIALGTGLLSGWYPGLLLSGFDPVRTLKGSARVAPGAAALRRGLIVVQFAIAVTLLAVGYVVHRQASYLTGRPLGFDREHVLAVESVPRDWSAEGVARMQAVKRRLEAVPGVRSVSLSWETAAGGGGNTLPVRRRGQDPEAAISASRFVVDEDFARTYGLHLVGGRFFEAGRAADSNAVVVNERAAAAFGLGEAGGTLVAGDGTELEVIGVVRDFHFATLHEPLRPLLLFSVYGSPLYRTFSLRLAPGDVGAVLSRVEAAWHEMLPDAAFEYAFVDDQVARQYETERRTRTVVALAAGLAVLVACLGILGLVALSVAQRRREVGVRKVLGAGTGRIVGLFVKDVGVLVGVGAAAALPVAYLLARRWLADFAYRIDLAWWMFALAALAALAVALGTAGLQAARAAALNPADVLRDE